MIHEEILDRQTTAIVCLDYNLEVIYMNSAAEILFSTSSIKGQGQSISGLAHFPSALISRFYEVMAKQAPYVERELSFLLPNLDTATVDCTISPFNKLNEYAGLLLELYKIDQYIQVVRDNNLLKQQEVSKNLLRNLAHEVKNPLGGLRGAAQLLALELPETSLLEYTDIIIREADRLHQLIDRLLGPSTKAKMSQINIHEVMEYVRRVIQADSENHVTLIADYDPSIPDIVADREQMIQVVLNIVKNAIQATQEVGEIILRTRISRYKTIGSELHKIVGVFDIIDDGPGVPSQLSELIFNPLVTNSAKGTGLGLSIAQSLVNQHGGIIEHHRKNNRTFFSIILPLGIRNAK